jgi:ribosomal protein S25
LQKLQYVKSNELKDKVLQIVKYAGKPVSVNYIAKELKVNWSTARAILLLLVSEGKLKLIDTTKSWVFVEIDHAC